MKSRILVAAMLVVAAFVGAQDIGAQQKQPKMRALSQNAVAEASQQHPQIVAQFGGEENAARSAYVRAVAARVAAQSNIIGGGDAFHVTTLNSPVMNAFAVPGGYLYITRQLLGLMNDEAELAAVLGHEAGHIACRHSSERRTASILSQLGAALVGAATGSNELGQLAAQGAQIWSLSYSRGQEYESDEFGVRYMAGAGYDPMGSPSMLDSLGAWTDLEARFAGREGDQRTVPSWARTHPMSDDRVARATQRAQATGRAGQGERNRDAYLAAIDGMIFDDDPAQGVIEGREFLHPRLGVAFTAPEGFGIQNGTSAVTVAGNRGQAQFSSLPYTRSLDDYLGQVFRRLTAGQGELSWSQPQRTTINGIPAAYATARANTQQGMVDVGVVAYQFAPDRAFHVVAVTPAGSGLGPFVTMAQSVRRLLPEDAAAVRPRIIRVVTVGPDDTIDSLAGRMAYPDFRRERFLVLNGLGTDRALEPGRKVKLIVYGNPG